MWSNFEEFYHNWVYTGTDVSLSSSFCPGIVSPSSTAQRAESSFTDQVPWWMHTASALSGSSVRDCQGQKFSLLTYFYIEVCCWSECFPVSFQTWVHGLMLHMLFLCSFVGAFFPPPRGREVCGNGRKWKDRIFQVLNTMNIFLSGTEEKLLGNGWRKGPAESICADQETTEWNQKLGLFCVSGSTSKYCLLFNVWT